MSDNILENLLEMVKQVGPISTNNDIIDFFKNIDQGVHIETYNTGVILIETDIYKLKIENLLALWNNMVIGYNVWFKHTKLYNNSWSVNNNFGTFPACGGLKNFEDVLQLLKTNSIHFIMED